MKYNIHTPKKRRNTEEMWKQVKEQAKNQSLYHWYGMAWHGSVVGTHIYMYLYRVLKKQINENDETHTHTHAFFHFQSQPE